MENLIFSLNATIPIFLMMVVGYLLNWLGVIDTSFANKLNKFVFNAALPVLLFRDLSNSDFSSVWDTEFVLFCFIATFLSILIMVAVSRLLKDKSIRGEFMQAGFRSSPALLGTAFLQNIYGKAGAASLMIIGAVPLYNIAAVIILALTKPEQGNIDRQLIKKTLYDVLTNPLIIGVILGMLWSLLKIPQPAILKKTVSSFSEVATPLGLMALGASFDVKKAFSKITPSLVSSFFKLIVFSAIFTPLAVVMGFRQDKLVSVLVMSGAAATISCFTMSRSMGHDGTLSASTVMLTTFFSAFTLTGWLYCLKVLGLI